MPDYPSSEQQGKTLTPKEDAAKTHALIAYILMIVGFFTGIFWLVGAVWAMVKREDAIGTVFEDHYSNIISLFWWGLILSIIGGILTIIFIGWLVLLGLTVWAIVKIAKGIANLTANKSYSGVSAF